MGQGNTSLKFDVLFWGLLSTKGFIFVKSQKSIPWVTQSTF